MRAGGWGVAAALALSAWSGIAAADPLLIQIGHGPAGEEQLWLMKARPDITPNQGKLYNLEWHLFGGAEPRFKAFDAGDLDIATTSGAAALFAASKGIPFKLIASISMESKKGFNAHFMVREDSPIHTLADLKGRIMAVNAYKSGTELWERIAAVKGGLDPDKDVKFAVVGFPSMGNAVRSKLVDVGSFGGVFYYDETRQGGLRTLFTTKDMIPEDEELQMIMTHQAFIDAHREVVKAFLADFVASTKWFTEHTQEAREDLIKSQMVMLKPEEFLPSPEMYRKPSGKPSIADLEVQQDILLKYGFQTSKVKVADYVDDTLVPQ
jgi:ABC-type nitrate/sulfonate/bicarbonate transport system substrate-binding protein